MGGCIEKRFEKMLHQYELDLLSPDDREKFELHLLECNSCFEQVQSYKEVSRHFSHSRNFRKLVKQTLSEKPETKQTSKSKIRQIFVPAVILSVIIFAFLILKPWKIEFQPTHDVIASENGLAIMYFENLSDKDDPDRLGEIITNLLITDISESRYIDVVSGQRLYDILKLLGEEDTKIINQQTATQIAREADARWMLLGNVIEKETSFIITAQLVETATGKIIATQKIEGQPDENIFSLADKLTQDIKKDIALPPKAASEFDPVLSEATTHSSLAYCYYLEGLDSYNKFYLDDARESFETALEYDSTFALAYYYLAMLKDPNLIYKALEYSDNVSQIDKYYIEIQEAIYSGKDSSVIELLNNFIERYPNEKYAYYLLGSLESRKGKLDRAIQYYSRAIEIDPLYKTVYNQLVYTHIANDNCEKALWAIDKYIEIAPDEANPYDTKGDLYITCGMLENAIETFKVSLKIKPDYYASLSKLGLMYLFNNDHYRADSCFDILLTSGNGNYKIITSLYQSYGLLSQGKFMATLSFLDDLIAADSAPRPGFHFIKAHIYTELDDWDMAISEMEQVINLFQINQADNKTVYRNDYIQLLAESGDITQAEKLAEQLKTDLEQNGQELDIYWYSLGAIELARGNYQSASKHFDKIRGFTSRFAMNFMAARSYQLANRTDDAIEEYENSIRLYGIERTYYGVWSIKQYFYLAQMYEQAGYIDRAAEQYQIFLDFWREADPGIEEIEDARERLAIIKSRS